MAVHWLRLLRQVYGASSIGRRNIVVKSLRIEDRVDQGFRLIIVSGVINGLFIKISRLNIFILGMNQK
jgi:hypothetical protein